MVERFREKLEKIEVTTTQWLVAFSCVLMVRFFLEALSSPSSSGVIASDAPTLVHYYLFFTSVSLALMLLLQYVLPTWKKAVPIMTLFAMALTSVPPVIDWIVSGGAGLSMSYLALSPAGMARSFLTFFGHFTTRGATIGMKVELSLIIFGVGALVYAVRKSAWRSLVAMLALYAIIFVSGAMPGILSAMAGLFSGNMSDPNQFIISSIQHSSTLADNIHGTLRYGSLQRLLEIGFDFMMGRIWFLVTSVLAGAWFFTNFRRQTAAVFKNLRPPKAFHYVFLIVPGMLIAYHQNHFSMNWEDWSLFITLALAFYCSWMYAVCVNDVFDTDIDQISNTGRPLPSGAMSAAEMRSAGALFLWLALLGGYLSGYYAFFCVLFFNAFAYLYSVPPTRFKRAPFLSSLIMSFCSLSLVMAGFFTFSSVKLVSAFSPVWIAGIVAFFFLLQQVKDLKDMEGDKAAGIMTIPTMFGSVWGPRVTGMLAAAAYLIVPLVAGMPALFLGSIPAAVISYYLLAVRRPYVEGTFFIVYYLFLIFLGIVFLA